MRICFDLSTLGAWNRKAHQQAWEQFLSRASGYSTNVTLTSEPSLADVIIHTGSPSSFDSSLASMVRPITDSDVRRLVWDWGDSPTGRFSGFYCSLNSGLFDRRRHRTMSYPIEFNGLIEEFPQADAVRNFSFVGGITSGVRARIFEAFRDTAEKLNAHVKVQAASWESILARQDDGIKRDYAESLRKARFILCPRGAGVGSVRLFETMRAGRVPVIIADGYVLPSDIDWQRCAITIGEREIGRIPEIIGSRMHEWSDMARLARSEWEANFADRSVLSYLARQLGELQSSRLTASAGFKAVYAARVTRFLVEQRLRPKAGRLRHRLRSRRN